MAEVSIVSLPGPRLPTVKNYFRIILMGRLLDFSQL